ncbi:MAG: hypothetical protein AAGK00_20390 [Pseudomonadota bacterium]
MINGTYTGVIQGTNGLQEAGSVTISGSTVFGETTRYALFGQLATLPQNRLIIRLSAKPYRVEDDHFLFDGQSFDVELFGELRGEQISLEGTVEGDIPIELRVVLRLRRPLAS